MKLIPRVKAVFVDTDLVPAMDSRNGDLVQNPTEAKLVYQVGGPMHNSDETERLRSLRKPSSHLDLTSRTWRSSHHTDSRSSF